jgi:hypothetical protein
MGTFRIRAASVQSQAGIGEYTIAGVLHTPGPPSNADLLTIVNHFPVDFVYPTNLDNAFANAANANPAFIGSVTLASGDSAGIFLDGSGSPTPESALPAGFTVTAAQINFAFAVFVGVVATLHIGALNGTPNGTTLAYPVGTTLAAILATTFGVTWNNPVPGVAADIVGSSLYITGTYDIAVPTAVTPDSGPFAGGTVVTITGTGFNSTTGVTFGGLPAAFTVISDTELTAVSPSHAAGPVTIAIAGTSRTAEFTYVLTKVLLPPVPRLH